MEQEETAKHPHGGIYNYFQGATIHNIVINGNMVKNGPDQYTSHREGSKKATPEQVASALNRCKAFVWGNAAYSVAFCVCRDAYGMEDNATSFERVMTERGVAIPAGTINTAFSRNPWMKYNIDNWEEYGVMDRVLKLRDEFRQQMDSLLIPVPTQST